MKRSLFLVLLALFASQGNCGSAGGAVSKNRPVSKVISLLKDMLKTMEGEQEKDEEIYDKLTCWCQNNDREKTKAIEDANEKLEDLTTKINELTAASARLNTEIKNLEKEVAENQNALDKATALRQKQLAEFNSESKDLMESINALKAATTVLAKHHTSMLQMPRNHLLTVAATVQNVLSKNTGLLQGAITPAERKQVQAFAQAPEQYVSFKQGYAPQSGEIFGIMKQMLETFQTNLGDSTKEEAANQKAYEDLKAAAESEIAAGTEQIDAKTQELAVTDEKNAEAKEDKVDTSKSLEADMKFMAVLKEKCEMTDNEWEERQKTRQAEMEAVSKALAVLSGDDAHDLFTRTFNPDSFVQLAASRDSAERTAASKVLSAAAKKANNPRLNALAYRVKLDAFTRVKAAIDEMVADLLKEKADEIKHKDFCVDEFNKNNVETERKDRQKADLIAKIKDLEQTIKALGDAIDSLKAQIADMQKEMKRAGENREKENHEFQSTVADQRETQKMLQAALSVLQEFYGELGVTLVQKQEPPAGFEAYKKNAQSGGVIEMLKTIINDAKTMEADALRSEDDAQKAYEEFVKETNLSIEAKSQEIVNKSEEKATAENDLVKAKESLDATMLELEQLANYKGQLHESCDYVMKNFEVRQTARDEEVEALRQAKAILSGAKFNSFLQG